MAGCGSYSKVEGFGFLPITCFALALTTFISQNLGCKGIWTGKKGGCLRRLLFHYHCRADRPGDLWPCTCTDRRIQQYAGGNLLWNSSGSCSYFILFSPGFLPLYGGDPPGSGKIHSTYAGHAGMLVYYPCYLHHHYRSFYPGHQGDLLGLSLTGL